MKKMRAATQLKRLGQGQQKAEKLSSSKTKQLE